MNMQKKLLEDYTESEFLELVTNISDANGSEQELDEMVEHFTQIVKHPESNGLIFYPPENREDSPEAVVAEIKRWYMEQGLPCFK
ncbi:hypothetical protein VRK_17050 [Vibrio sp. MEBiC08052]|nr:hypothetical protein VRK_17050 [Vibrio sp. MEBiC08052]